MLKRMMVCLFLVSVSLWTQAIWAEDVSPVPDQPVAAAEPAPAPVATAEPAVAQPVVAQPEPAVKEQRVTEELLFMMPIVVTAAKKEQTVAEAPGVVTVISADQIKKMGARNLMDVLKTVPGFMIMQDSNEHLGVLRGIYASTNQKFLVMRDGHRLNEWMWNSTEHDYSLTLSNVKRIEIVRGPGASLYGSAALCGVVNIITKEAEEVDGTELKLGYGKPQQIKGDVVYGKKYNQDESLLAWGSIYRTEGEKVDVPRTKDAAANKIDGYMLMDKRGPSYDVGMKLKENKFTFSGAMRNSDYVQPAGNGGQVYDPSRIEMVELRQIFRFGQLDLTWEDKIAEMVTLKLNHYYDYVYWNSWQWAAPARDQAPQGRIFNWDVEGQSYGLNYSGSYNLGEGSILVGLQAEQRELFKSTASMNYNLPTGYPLNSNPVYLLDILLKPGGEYYLAGYAQADYKFFDQIMVNGGVRYDHYKDVGGSISPRGSVIYNPDFLKELYWKAIYGKAFLNPSYFYRFNTGKLGYFGGPDLKPEGMESYQTELSYYIGKMGSIKVCGFYNIVTDLISQKTGYATYINFGKISVEGGEIELDLKPIDMISLFANFTYQKPDIGATDPAQLKFDTLKNMPSAYGNAGITVSPIEQLDVNVTANWHGVIEAPTVAGMTDFGVNYQLPPDVILNMNLLVKKFWNTMEVSIAVNNLTNREYYLTGTTTPFRQPGRWVLTTIGYKF